jgi:hypothetical protein
MFILGSLGINNNLTCSRTASTINFGRIHCSYLKYDTLKVEKTVPPFLVSACQRANGIATICHLKYGGITISNAFIVTYAPTQPHFIRSATQNDPASMRLLPPSIIRVKTDHCIDTRQNCTNVHYRYHYNQTSPSPRSPIPNPQSPSTLLSAYTRVSYIEIVHLLLEMVEQGI